MERVMPPLYISFKIKSFHWLKNASSCKRYFSKIVLFKKILTTSTSLAKVCFVDLCWVMYLGRLVKVVQAYQNNLCTVMLKYLNHFLNYCQKFHRKHIAYWQSSNWGWGGCGKRVRKKNPTYLTPWLGTGILSLGSIWNAWYSIINSSSENFSILQASN